MSCVGLGTAFAVARFLVSIRDLPRAAFGRAHRSPAIGTATEAIGALPLPGCRARTADRHIAVADARATSSARSA